MTENPDADAGQRVDRRVRRTQHALRHALMELVMEKGYDRVTVQDVIDRADVGRSTFYSHFRDKEDLFLSGIEDEVREAFDTKGSSGGGSPSLWLFRHAGEHADLYRVLVRRRGGWQLVSRRIEDTLVEVFEVRLREAPGNSVPIEAAARFLGSALMGFVSWWLAEGMPLEPDVMDEAFRALAANGTRSTLGVEI